MPTRLTFEYNPLSYAYPDDETDKELFLQAPGTIKDPLVYWVNMVFNDGEEVWQVVRLENRDNVYKYVYPDMIVIDGSEREHNKTFSLGMFNRDQRETVLECADEIQYDERSSGEGQCLHWMSELLEQMVSVDLLTRAVVEAIREALPLPSPDLNS